MEEQLRSYAARLQAAHPAVSVTTMRRIGQGQNNDTVLVNDALIVRFPRYEQGILDLEREVTVLRALQGRLPLAIPAPLCVALTPRAVGQVFMAYPFLPGTPLDGQTLSRLDQAEVTELAGGLGDFLRCLHQLPLEDLFPGGAPWAGPLAGWEELYNRLQQRLFPHMRPEARAQTVAHFESFLRNPRNRLISPVLAHGDLGAGNILYAAQRHTLVGIIDFAGAGPHDPAVGLAAIATLRPDILDLVLRTYPQEPEVLERVAFYRGTFALQEALFGLENDDETAFRAGIVGYV